MEPASIYTDLLTFVLESNFQYDDQRPLYIDAENPTHALNGFQFRMVIKSFIAGLRVIGLQRGDCVLVHLGNSVPFHELCLHANIQS